MNRELRSCLWKDNSSRCKILHTEREWTIWYNFHFHFTQCSSYSVSTLCVMNRRDRCMSAKKRWKCERKTSTRGKLGKIILFSSHARQLELQSIFFFFGRNLIFSHRDDYLEIWFTRGRITCFLIWHHQSLCLEEWEFIFFFPSNYAEHVQNPWALLPGNGTFFLLPG